jgi:hypothetical protein
MTIKNTDKIDDSVLFELINVNNGQRVGEVRLTIAQAERFIKVFGDDYRLESIDEVN